MKNNTEVWKIIPSTDGLYEASSLGRIRRIYKNRPPRIRALSYKPGTKYLRVSLSLKGKTIHRSVHRLVCEAFHGPSKGMEVDHMNNTPDDNRPENLEWVTRPENTQRSYDRGYKKVWSEESRHKLSKSIKKRFREMPDAHPRGSKIARSVINEDIAAKIINLLRDKNLSMAFIAREVGVRYGIVCSIAYGLTWKHVPR